ncbi:MAG: hypothetical protein Q9188_006010, partial [Gyalolechia gomerana]
MSCTSSTTSPSPPCPAAENLAEALSFKSKKKTPSTVTFLPPQSQQQQQQQQTPQGEGNNNPRSTTADPVKYVTWGPKTVFYAVSSSPSQSSSSSSSSSSKDKKKKHRVSKWKGKKDKAGADEQDIKFEQWTFNGSEEVQTTETTEILGLEEEGGGGVKRTWVLTSKTVVVAVERGVDAKEVVVE